MKLRNYTRITYFVLFLLSACKNIETKKPESLSGHWKLQSRHLTDINNRVIPGSENIITNPSTIAFNKDSTFKMTDNGNIISTYVAELLKLDSIIIGSWNTSQDSIQLVIPFKSQRVGDSTQFVTATYKIIDNNNSIITLKEKLFETKTYSILKFSKD